jgi:hypothetical protein
MNTRRDSKSGSAKDLWPVTPLPIDPKELSRLDPVSGFPAAIATLSVRVSRERRETHVDNGEMISKIIERRRPRLLLCAGAALPSKGNCVPIRRASKSNKTTVLLETTHPKPEAWRIRDGKQISMGRQAFARGSEVNPKVLAELIS